MIRASNRALSLSLRSLGRFQEAAREAEITVSLNPTNVQSLTTLGDIYDLWGKYNLAAAAWEKAVALDSTASLVNRLGSTYVRAGRYRKAVEAHERPRTSTRPGIIRTSAVPCCSPTTRGTARRAREYLDRALRRATKLRERVSCTIFWEPSRRWTTSRSGPGGL